MDRRAPLILVADPNQLASGLLPDRHSLQVPLWEAAGNVRFYQGKVARLVPATQAYINAGIGGGDVAARGLGQLQASDGVRWVYSAHIRNTGLMYIYRWYGPASELISTLGDLQLHDTALVQAHRVDFLNWGDWMLFNAGSGPIQRFQPGIGAGALPNSPEDVVAILKKANQLVAVGHGPNKKRVSISNADDITDWANGPESVGNSLPLEELETGIRAAARLGPHIACYAEDQLAFVSYVGAPAYFGQRVVLDGVGAVGKGAVCSDGRVNYGVSRNGIWRTDGNEFQYIDEGAMNEYLQANVNWDQAGKIVAHRNDHRRTFEFFFPTGANLENSEGWSFDPTNGAWSPIPAWQAADERRLLRRPLLAAANAVYLGEDNPLAAAPLTLRTKPMLVQGDGGQGLHASAKIDQMHFMLKAAVGVQVRYETSQDIGATWTNSDWFTLSTDMRTYHLGPEVPTGTYHRLRFQSIIDAWELDLQGFALFGALDGTVRETQ